MGVGIVNDSTEEIKLTVGGVTISVASGNANENFFDNFTEFTLSATGDYRCYILGALGVAITLTDTEAQPDITPPIVNAEPSAGTFSAAQEVTLMANETATIFYTTDGSDPTTASAVYSEPIHVTATTTLMYFGKDTAGNSSAVQSSTYTLNLPALSMNGATDWLLIPTIPIIVTDLEMRINVENNGGYYYDTRENATSSYMFRDAASGKDQRGPNEDVYVDGVMKANSIHAVNNGVERTLKVHFWTGLTSPGNMHIFCRSTVDARTFMKGKIYDIKLYNGANVVAHYDMSTGTVKDQSGNDNHATLNGGTFG
ncbi:hypothetical protein GC093_29485 [Paenibacillus sp. LMG 31456]|uniref:GH29D-like beta-sandwich domain-containing protein n=2 Tax=Paenibacillus foliorum TaxID=2654974 RepID=A0A972GUW8_9BACL|nr:hypothetical protein [Paenibacillus foliorum]